MKRWIFSATLLTFFCTSSGGFTQHLREKEEHLEARCSLSVAVPEALLDLKDADEKKPSARGYCPRFSLSTTSANFLYGSLVLVSTLGMAMARDLSSSSEETRPPIYLQMSDGSACVLREPESRDFFQELWNRGLPKGELLTRAEKMLCYVLRRREG